MRRRAGRWVVPLLAVALVGCGDGAATPSSVPTAGPSASVAALGEAELGVCDGIYRMTDGVTRLRAVRLRRGADARLSTGLDLVVEGQRLVVDYAPTRMFTRVRTLGFAVTNMTIAVEGFHTASQVDDAAANVKRRITALGRAIDGFHAWVGCPGPAPAEDGEAPLPSGSVVPSVPPGG